MTSSIIMRIQRNNPYRLLFLLSLLLSLAACETYGNVTVANDSFRQGTVVNLKLLHKSVEAISGLGGQKFIEAAYTRTRKQGVPSPVEMKIILDITETAELKSEAFVQIDAQAFELQLTGINRTTNVRPQYDLIPFGRSRTGTTYKAFGTFRFTPEFWQKMMQAQGLSYRIYVDQTPYTIRVSADDFQKLRLFDRQ